MAAWTVSCAVNQSSKKVDQLPNTTTMRAYANGEAACLDSDGFRMAIVDVTVSLGDATTDGVAPTTTVLASLMGWTEIFGMVPTIFTDNSHACRLEYNSEDGKFVVTGVDDGAETAIAAEQTIAALFFGR